MTEKRVCEKCKKQPSHPSYGSVCEDCWAEAIGLGSEFHPSVNQPLNYQGKGRADLVLDFAQHMALRGYRPPQRRRTRGV